MHNNVFHLGICSKSQGDAEMYNAGFLGTRGSSLLHVRIGVRCACLFLLPSLILNDPRFLQKRIKEEKRHGPKRNTVSEIFLTITTSQCIQLADGYF
jgi:hypothetical protein